MKLDILLLFCLLTVLAAGDCVFTNYPRMVTVGHLQAHIGRDSQQHDTDLIYEYPLAQIVKIDDLSQASKNKNCMISVNGIETIRAQPYEEMKFSIEVIEAKLANHYSQNLITGIAFKITVGSTPSSNNHRRYNWNYVKLNFVYSYNPQLFVGEVRSPQILPSNHRQIYHIKDSFDKRAPQNGFNIKNIIPKIFLTGLHAQQQPFVSENYGFDIEGTIEKIQRLRHYSWNDQIVNKLKKALTDQKIPSFQIGQAKVYQESRGKKNTFELLFNIKTTTSLRILAFSYSYMFYLEKSQERYQYNSYRSTQGNFIAKNNDVIFYQGIQHTGMFMLGFNGYRASYASINQYDEFGFDIQYGETGSSSQNYFLHVRAKNQNSEFFFDYFGIQTIPSQYCLDCPGSPYLYENQFCVSVCPEGYVQTLSSQGYHQCLECQIQKFLVPDHRTNSCRCPRKFYYIAPRDICEECPKDCLTCNGNRCLTCDNSRALNIHTSRCQCLETNPHGIAYFNNNQGQCQKCHQTCKKCFGGKPNECTQCKFDRVLTRERYCGCKQNFKEDENGICRCLPPYSYNGNNCEIVHSRCAQNEQYYLNSYQQSACGCITGYFRHIITNICIQVCKDGQIFSYLINQCECPRNMVYDSISEACIDCGHRPNQFYNKLTKKCDCINADFSLNPHTNQCIKCPLNQYFDFRKGECTCIFNFYKYGNQCIRCKNSYQGEHCQTNDPSSTNPNNFNIGNSISDGHYWGFQSIYNNFRMLI